MHHNQKVATKTGLVARIRQRQVVPLTREWTAYGWIAAVLLILASLHYPVTVQSSPVINGSGDLVSRITTTFDAWGGITVDPVNASGRWGGPNYGLVLVPCILLIVTALTSLFLPSRYKRFGWAAPVAASCLGGVGACQFLAYQANSQPWPNVNGLDIAHPTWQLGASPWLLFIGSIIAFVTWLGRNGHASSRERPAVVSVNPVVVHDARACVALPTSTHEEAVPVGADALPRSRYALPGLAAASASDKHVWVEADPSIFKRPTDGE